MSEKVFSPATLWFVSRHPLQPFFRTEDIQSRRRRRVREQARSVPAEASPGTARTSLPRTSAHQHGVPSYRSSQAPSTLAHMVPCILRFEHIGKVSFSHYLDEHISMLSPLPRWQSLPYRIVRSSDLRNTRRPGLSRTRVVPRKPKAVGLVLQQRQVLLDNRRRREGSSRS